MSTNGHFYATPLLFRLYHDVFQHSCHGLSLQPPQGARSRLLCVCLCCWAHWTFSRPSLAAPVWVFIPWWLVGVADDVACVWMSQSRLVGVDLDVSSDFYFLFRILFNYQTFFESVYISSFLLFVMYYLIKSHVTHHKSVCGSCIWLLHPVCLSPSGSSVFFCCSSHFVTLAYICILSFV